MGFRDRMTTGIQQKPLKCCWYGTEGVGKSSFAAQFPGSIFLAAEDGTNQIDTRRVVPADWVDAIELLKEFANDSGGDIQTVNIDTIGWLIHLLNDHICRREGVSSIGEISYGRGKGMVFSEFQNLIRWTNHIHGSGKHVNIIAHASISLFKNPEAEDYDRFHINTPSNDKSIEDEIRQWADIVGFFNYDTSIVEVQDGMRTSKKAQSHNARRLHFNRSAAFDAKNRFNLPNFIDLGKACEEGFDKFWNLYSNATAAAPVAKKTRKKPANKPQSPAPSVGSGPPPAPAPPPPSTTTA